METETQNSGLEDRGGSEPPQAPLVTPQQQRGDRLLAILALAGIVGPFLFVITFTLLGFLRTGYSHVADTISLLAEPGAWTAPYQTANFVVLGLLTVAFALALHRGVGGGRGSRLGPVLIALFGLVGLIGSAAFPCDPGCEAVTTTGRLHEAASGIGFLCFILGLFVVRRRLQQEAVWRPLAPYTLVTGAVATVLLVAFGAVVSGAVEALQPWAGLFQRLFVLSVLQWMVVMGLRLRRLAGAAHRSPFAQT